ncbi:MAG: hypothetical protein AVDCRST_MAG87-1240 [uncultured Thermomicrobiales bacterium]|uniref:CHAD domain-containing protein n=1 Tax=uncultured Thermomicrobiales bacterium TaxID=1645740 RepID=A0A6J4US62_9BACT|nr:MAG: hypothetical protein AVDCRST_MAG87-1240 [uncultured Thermomicrobiales bacterium]
MTAKPAVSKGGSKHEQLQDRGYREAMRDAIGTQWRSVWKPIPAVIASEDPEAVHKVRVASRRLRAAMDVGVDAFPRKWYRPLHKTAKRITRALGEVRDRDVMLEALARERKRSTGPERRAIDHLIADITRDRKRARKAMVRFLAELDDEGVRKETKRRFPRPKRGRAALGGTPGDQHPQGDARTHRADGGPDDAGEPGTSRHAPMLSLDPGSSLETNARGVLAVRIEDLFRYGPIIPDAEASEALHDARIATKRLRYTLELFPSVFGEDGGRAIDGLKDLQEELGVLHDHDVRIALLVERLSHLGDDNDPKANELRAGFEALLQRERDARATSHAAVVERWYRLEREQFGATLRALTVVPE